MIRTCLDKPRRASNCYIRALDPDYLSWLPVASYIHGYHAAGQTRYQVFSTSWRTHQDGRAGHAAPPGYTGRLCTHALKQLCLSCATGQGSHRLPQELMCQAGQVYISRVVSTRSLLTT